MRPETEAFLARVRDAEDPTRADERRVLLALRASLAAGAATSALAASLEPRRLGELGGRALGSLGSKLNVLLLCGAAALGTADTPHTPAEPARTAPASALIETTSPETLPTAPPSPTRVEPPLTPPALQRPQPGTERAPDAEQRAPTPSSQASQSDGAGRERGVPRERSPSLRAELDLLRVVRDALRRADGAAALRALDAHHTRDRTLLAERQAARVLALCNLGRVSEAQRAAAAFEREHPGSVQADVIARSCANPRRMDGPSRH